MYDDSRVVKPHHDYEESYAGGDGKPYNGRNAGEHFFPNPSDGEDKEQYSRDQNHQ